MSPISQITDNTPRATLNTIQAGQLVLLVSSNGKSRGCLRLSEKNVLVGSSPDCTVCLRSTWVKDFQCQIIQGKHHTIIRNLSPDTRLNDQMFTEAWLKPGDRISCGPVDINVLEIGSRQPEQTAASSDDESDNKSGGQPAANEVLQQLQQQAAELRRSLEQERERSEHRVRELESNLLTSRDHLRNAREQLMALRGGLDQNEPKSETRPETEPKDKTGQELEISKPAETAQLDGDRWEPTFDLQLTQPVEEQEQSPVAQDDPAIAEEEVECFPNFMAAEACCDVENCESEECEELLEDVDLIEASDDAPEESLVSITEDEEDNVDETQPFSEQTDLQDCQAPVIDTINVEETETEGSQSEIACDTEEDPCSQTQPCEDVSAECSALFASDEQFYEEMPAETEESCDEEDSSNSGVLEMHEAFQIEYVDSDSLSEAECYESVEDFYETTIGTSDLDDHLAASEQVGPTETDLQADDDGENATEMVSVAKSLKAWFNPEREAAGLEPELELPVDRDEPKNELPENLLAIIRECEQVTSTVEEENQSELETESTDLQSPQTDESDDVGHRPNGLAGLDPSGLDLAEPPQTDEIVHEDPTVLPSSAEEFVASESDVFETAVGEQYGIEESTCEVLEEAKPNAAEPENADKCRSLVGRIRSLFGKGSKSSAAVDEIVEEGLHNEPAVDCCDEIADVESVATEQLDSDSPCNEEEEEQDPCGEEFDLTADWKTFLAGYQPQKSSHPSETEPLCTYESENARDQADTDEQDACTESESVSMTDLTADFSSEEAIYHEPSTVAEQLDEMNFSDGHDDELESSYEKVLDSLRTSSETNSEPELKVSESSTIADDEQSCGYEQMKENLWEQCESAPHLDVETPADSECKSADLSDKDAEQAAGDINSEDDTTDSSETTAQSQQEDSIEDYMNQLLQRAGVSRQNVTPPSSPVEIKDTAMSAEPAPQVPRPQDLLAKTFSEDLESRKKELGPVEISPKSLPALEVDHFDEMRLMARQSANSAIEASLRRKTSTQATVQLGIGCMLLVGGIVQTTLAQGLTSASALATVPCYVASAYFFKKYFDWRKSFTSLDAKLKKEADHQKQLEKNSNTPEPSAEPPGE